jgi:hypothetical protein
VEIERKFVRKYDEREREREKESRGDEEKKKKLCEKQTSRLYN